MAQQLTIKAFLKRWDVKRKQLESVDEIRRFSMDQDVATSYTCLLEKLVNVFPGLINKPIMLYWRGLFLVIEIVLSGEGLRSANHLVTRHLGDRQ